MSTAADWNRCLAGLPHAHVLQSWEWGEFKSDYDWQPFHLLWLESESGLRLLPFEQAPNPQNLFAAALILKRSLSFGGLSLPVSVLYVPKGPVLRAWEDDTRRRQVLADLALFARRQGALFVKIDPDLCLGLGVPGAPEASEDAVGLQVQQDLLAGGWFFSAEQVQFRNSMLVDLSQGEESLLANMKQKTRYNLRLASRKGVQVRPARLDELPLLYRLYAETSLRDGFVIRDQGYYLRLWRAFIQAGLAHPLLAEAEGTAAAGLVLFTFAGTAWFFYGMSGLQHREKMPSYLLQWEAMRLARELGCRWYDLWGAPDDFQESDPLWGVYRFKEGLGAQVVRRLGAWDLVLRPGLYRLYAQVLPRLLGWMRRRGSARTQRSFQQTL